MQNKSGGFGVVENWDRKDEIVSFLEDEQSKEIYRLWCCYYDTKRNDYLYEIVDKYVPELGAEKYYNGKEDILVDIIKEKKHVVIFGAGGRGRELLRILSEKGVKVDMLVDNNVALLGEKVYEMEILSPEKIDCGKTDCVIVTPHNTSIMEAIHTQLNECGIEDGNIFFYRNYIFASLENQYFEEKIIKYEEEEVFVDAGALNLGTSLEFINRCKKSGVQKIKVYAFEPNRSAHMDCQEVAKKHPYCDIHLYNAGLWSCEQKLYFVEGSTGNSKVSDAETELSIDAVALDHCVDDKVTFIKMDIEGAELEALHGCKEIIKKYKPKLAICIYHKQSDLIDIPLYIKELVPEYKLYIRHYSNCGSETVLYAVFD